VAKSDEDDTDGDAVDNLSLSPRYDLSTAQRLALVIERQNNLLNRVKTLERRQGEISSLLNKVTGALALVSGVGVVVGWLLSVSGNVLSWLR